MLRGTFWWLVISASCAGCSADWAVELDADRYEVHMGAEVTVHYNVTGEAGGPRPAAVSVRAQCEDERVASVAEPWPLRNVTLDAGWPVRLRGETRVRGTFLGLTRVSLRLTAEGDPDDPDGGDGEPDSELAGASAAVTVTRGVRAVDRTFTVSVAVLVALVYVNFGCALHWAELRPILARPVAPCVGLACQLLAMPALALALGALAFPAEPALRLGLLFVGVSPAGGASNVWACVLDANVHLSVTMTALGTVASCASMPLWLLGAGRALFRDAAISVPYVHVASLAGSLYVPLAVGWLLQRRWPRVAAALARRLKLLSTVLIAVIVVFAAAINLHMLRLFTWRVALAGAALPWLGFAAGYVVAAAARRPAADRLAIAIETGVQNSGIAIFLLRWTLPQPQADLTTVLPVMVSMATPLPLAALWLAQRVARCRARRPDKGELPTADDDESAANGRQEARAETAVSATAL